MKKKLYYTLLIFLISNAVLAHEVRPAYLGITQTSDTTYTILWKIPAMGELAPRIYPVLPEAWSEQQLEAQLIPGAVKKQWEFTYHQSLNGHKIYIEGLASTLIDVLVNIELLNGEQYSRIIRADEPFYTIPREPTISEVVYAYLVLGIDHILLGIDHLLFVLALVIITTGKWKIVKTVTAFTIAHSITLSLAALGFFQIPIPPVEAVIALSIVFLAYEILKHREGKNSLTYQRPWLVAFVFGLLHGFGFASALSETGLPQSNIPTALAFFNIGVELGQLAFVAIVLVFLFLANNLRITWPVWTKKVPIYTIGAVACFWLIERVVGFW